MAGVALRRLMTEFKQLTANPPEGIYAGPSDDENFFEWDCLITGPEGTCFENGVFTAKITFSEVQPNDESAANVNAAKMWREDRAQFEAIADNLVRKTLGLPPRKAEHSASPAPKPNEQ
ncbi:UBIQUITIN-CONJUGAT-2 domain-containing protein [Aphelenchoides fujianensis]|nr:UBIQUITIN-CONJUGAT-2 domain-containing protein [Aphelenchoides fujianensis]